MFRFRAATESVTCPLTGWAILNDDLSFAELVLSLLAKESTTKKGAASGPYNPSVAARVGAGSAVRPFGAPAPPARIPDAPPSLGEPRGGTTVHRTTRHGDGAAGLRIAAWQDGDMFRFRAVTESATCPLTGWTSRNGNRSLLPIPYLPWAPSPPARPPPQASLSASREADIHDTAQPGTAAWAGIRCDCSDGAGEGAAGYSTKILSISSQCDTSLWMRIAKPRWGRNSTSNWPQWFPPPSGPTLPMTSPL